MNSHMFTHAISFYLIDFPADVTLAKLMRELTLLGFPDNAICLVFVSKSVHIVGLKKTWEGIRKPALVLGWSEVISTFDEDSVPTQCRAKWNRA